MPSESTKHQKNPSQATIWGLRLLFFAVLFLMCWWAGSGVPALGFALAWGPNGLFLAAYTKGALPFPRFLERVYSFEPVLYRCLGVGFVKRMVATRLWPLVAGVQPQTKVVGRQAFLTRLEGSTKCAEICHGGTFVLALLISVICFAVGQSAAALWILGFNVALNGYPIMLQRTHRWRIQQIRSKN